MNRPAPLTFEVAGNTLTGGVARHPDPKAVVVLCHGTPSGYPDEPGDPGYPGLAAEIAAEGFEVWWFNFRGARDSEGAFTFSGWCEDLDQVTRQIDKGALPLLVVGASAGGAVAISVAAGNEVIDGVATLAAPATWDRHTDEEDMLQEAKRVGTVPVGFPPDEDDWWAEFLDNPAVEAIERLDNRPVLVMHGTEDQAVRPDDARRLHAAARNSKLVLIEGAGHQLRRNPRVIAELKSWLREAVAATPR